VAHGRQKEHDVFKELANLGSLLRHAQEISGRMQGLTDELRSRRAIGSAGGGLVEIEVNGLVEVLRCHIDPKLLSQSDQELLEDLVATAVNQAVAKAKELHAETVRSLTGGINLPVLEQAMAKFMGTDPPKSE